MSFGKIRALLTLLLSFSAVGCGMLDMPNKMEGTLNEVKETNKKMEGMLNEVRETNKKMEGMLTEVKGTNGKMEGMNSEVKTTNEKMGDMLSEVKETNKKMEGMNSEVKETNKKMDGMQDAVKETNKKMDGMQGAVKDTNAGLKESNDWIKESKRGIDRTGDGVHKQKLLLAMQDMLKPENTEFLVPPTGMMPGGETFAQEATTSELMKLAFVWLKEVEKGTPDEVLKDTRGRFPESVVYRVDREKQVKLIALQVIAGLLAQSPQFELDENGNAVISKDGKRVRDGSNTSVEEIIENEINKGGRFEDTAYALLMARAMFLRDILIEPMFDEKITNIGELEEAYQWVSYYDQLARLPFVGQIRLKTTGMLNAENNLDEKLDPRSCGTLWERLAKAADTDVQQKYRSEEKFSTLRGKIDEAVNYWKRAQFTPTIFRLPGVPLF